MLEGCDAFGQTDFAVGTTSDDDTLALDVQLLDLTAGMTDRDLK
jgi:hypothetical protein